MTTKEDLHEKLLEDFAISLGKRVSVRRYNGSNFYGTYIVNGTETSFKNTSPIVLLPFCIKNPSCTYRKEKTCDFSLEECKSDQTKGLIEILNNMHFSYYFNTDFEDVQKSIKKHAQNYGNLESCITVCCPNEMLHIENEFANYIKLLQIPVLLFFVGNYKKCRIDGLSARYFNGQTQIDTKAFNQTIRDLFL